MALTTATLHRVVNNPDMSLYLYNTADAIATVVASGYFNGVSAELRKGDVIVVVDTATPTVDVVVVSSADAAATVTTVNGT